MKKILFAAILLITCNAIVAQPGSTRSGPPEKILPVDHDTLNYRLVGFSLPEFKGATNYELEVFEYMPQDDGKDIQTRVVKKVAARNRFVETVPAFGKNYKWHMRYLRDNKIIDSSAFHYFSTGYSVTIDTNRYRLRIIDNKIKDPDMYLLLDFISVIYDLDGNPLWYLPDIPLVADKDIQMRDLKPTLDGTFTGVSGQGAHEFDYDGRVIWTASNDGTVNGDSTEYYHHEFTKLPTGHYMVCGHEQVLKKVPDFVDTGMLNKAFAELHDDGKYYVNLKAATLIEYDAKGKVVWYWKAAEHCPDADFFRKGQRMAMINTDMHLNAFEFDVSNHVIYLSFRNTNQIVKIDYPSGNIIASYGINSDDRNDNKDTLFYGQHCIKKAKDGRLYLFNNNSRVLNMNREAEASRDMLSYITILRENPRNPRGIEKIWEFPCDIDTFALPGAGAGGSVSMLENNTILASMGAASRIFIVNMDKKVLWNAVPQIVDPGNNWHLLGQYRTSYINKQDIERFIFK